MTGVMPSVAHAMRRVGRSHDPRSRVTPRGGRQPQQRQNGCPAGDA
jgi:hypothetical protein